MFYAKLKEICKEKKTSPSAVALAIGISKSNVTKWQAGQTPKMENIVAIANFLNVDIWDLIDEEKPAAITDNELSPNAIRLIKIAEQLPPDKIELLESYAEFLRSTQ